MNTRRDDQTKGMKVIEDDQMVQQLTERVEKHEEQAEGMCRQIQRLKNCNMASDSTECGKEKGEHDDENHFGRCRWDGAWWIKVEQGLNSRQRTKVSRGLQRLVAREKEETSASNLIGHIRREIWAEIIMKNASNAHAQHCKLSSDDEDQEAAETRDHDGVDWAWYDTTEQDTKPRSDT